MKTPEQKKQMAEAMALEVYPSDHDQFTMIAREGYAKAIIDTYKEPERVNEKLEEILYSDVAIEKWFDENIGKDCSASSVIYKFRLDLRKILNPPKEK